MRNSRILGRLVSISTIVAIGLFSAENAHAEADSFGFGSGRSGDVTISAANTVVNSYASVTTTVTTGATTIQVDSVTGFAAGDLIMIWKSTGLALTRASGSQVTIPMDGDSTGTFEYARIKSTAPNLLTLTNPIVSATDFTALQSQVVRIPEFRTLTINSGAGIAAGPWDGTKGGIVAVFADTSVVNNGTIAADAQGLRGGVHKQDDTVFGCSDLDGPVVADALNLFMFNALAGGAKKGEGLFPDSYSIDTTTDASNPLNALYNTYGYGNVSTGGGGGDCHNAGGGGGGHAGLGGTGGETYSGETGIAGLPAGSRAVGGTGGTIITYTPTIRMSMGGAGGAGEDNDGVGTAGASGGGVVFVRAVSLSGTGTLSSDGASAGNSVTPNYDGAGGGGAGGLVVVRVMTTAACSAIHANGGAGGNSQDGHGPGGGGAGGYILVQAATDTCGTGATENGGPPGTDLLDDAGNDGHRGASGGGGGATATPPPGGFNPTGCDVAIGTCGGCTSSADCNPGDTCNPVTNQCDFPDGGIDDGGVADAGEDGGAGDGGANDGGLADGGSRDGGGTGDAGLGDGGGSGDSGLGDGGNGNGDGGEGSIFDLGSLEGGGCGCSTPGSSGGGNTAAFSIAAMAALALVRRRRNKKK